MHAIIIEFVYKRDVAWIKRLSFRGDPKEIYFVSCTQHIGFLSKYFDFFPLIVLWRWLQKYWNSLKFLILRKCLACRNLTNACALRPLCQRIRNIESKVSYTLAPTSEWWTSFGNNSESGQPATHGVARTGDLRNNIVCSIITQYVTIRLSGTLENRVRKLP